MKRKIYEFILIVSMFFVLVGCAEKQNHYASQKETYKPSAYTYAETPESTVIPTDELITPTKETAERPTTTTMLTPTPLHTQKPTVIPTETQGTVSTHKLTPLPTPTLPTPTPLTAPTKAPTTKPAENPTQKLTAMPTQTPTVTPTQAPFVVDYTQESTVSGVENYKYGLKKTTITITYYSIYSDGSKKAYSSYSYEEFDTSGYSATDAELMDESKSVAADNMEYYLEVLNLVNEIRKQAGVAPVVLDEQLCNAATMRALEMNYSQNFSHTRPNGTSCFTVFDTFGIPGFSFGENIAAGYGSPASVVEGWKNSPGHYANMINASFTKIGIGMSDVNIGYGIYWAQIFVG